MSSSHGDDTRRGNPERDTTQRDSSQHFDELEAVRRFPSEDDWLDLPMPEDLPGEASGDLQGDAPNPQADDATRSFTDRVVKARRDECEVDAAIEELDRQLPPALLEQFSAPEPSDGFVDATVRALQADRRQRWQTMLARHVAPEPSPEFVNRTLAALNEDADDDQPATPRRAGTAASTPASPSPLRRVLPFVLAAAALALITLQMVTTDTRPPLEQRLAQQAPQTAAYANSTTPLAAVFAAVAAEDEPHALFDEPVDGLWLASASGEIR